MAPPPPDATAPTELPIAVAERPKREWNESKEHRSFSTAGPCRIRVRLIRSGDESVAVSTLTVSISAVRPSKVAALSSWVMARSLPLAMRLANCLALASILVTLVLSQ